MMMRFLALQAKKMAGAFYVRTDNGAVLSGVRLAHQCDGHFDRRDEPTPSSTLRLTKPCYYLAHYHGYGSQPARYRADRRQAARRARSSSVGRSAVYTALPGWCFLPPSASVPASTASKPIWSINSATVRLASTSSPEIGIPTRPGSPEGRPKSRSG